MRCDKAWTVIPLVMLGELVFNLGGLTGNESSFERGLLAVCFEPDDVAAEAFRQWTKTVDGT